MKKSFQKILLIFLMFPIIFLSCKENKDEEKVNPHLQAKINSFIYDYTYKELNNRDNNKNYIPEAFKTELNRHIIKNERFYTFFDIYFSGRIDLNEYSDIYDGHSDNGEWVDRVLFSVEQERISDELQNMEEFVNSGAYIADETSNASEAEKIAVEIQNYDGTLSSMEYDNEILVSQKNGDNWILINACGENVTRRFYDSLYRCFLQEKWEIDNKGKEKLKKVIKTNFHEKSYKPMLKMTTLDNSEKKQTYNKQGFLIKEDFYNINEKEKQIKYSLNLKYDKENRILESSKYDYVYEENNPEKLEYSINKKFLYKYKNIKASDNKDSSDDKNKTDDIPPDFDYYEDDKLKVRNVYKSEDDYTSQIFFEDGFHVTAFYEKGKLVKEVFVTNYTDERIINHEE